MSLGNKVRAVLAVADPRDINNGGAPILKPGDPAYSPAVSVADDPQEYGQRSQEARSGSAADPGGKPGFWAAPVNVNPSQYIDLNVGGVAGDANRLGWSRGIVPNSYYRQPFSGAMVVPPRAPVVNVGYVGRNDFRSRLGQRVRALTTDYAPTIQAATSAVVNPRI